MVVSENAIEASISSRKNKTSFCDTTASASSSSLVVDDSSLSESELSSSAEHLEAVREYYISLLQDEYNRLQIVELSENLANIDERLDGFLGYEI
jgi:hypothetical protein